MSDIEIAQPRWVQDFVEIRASGTPWALVVTPDVEETVATLSEAASRVAEQAKLDTPPQLMWNLASGHRALVGSALVIGGDTTNKPFPLLTAALSLPRNSILFVEVPGSDFWRSEIVVSAIANLRVPFKASTRTLVLVAKPGAGDVLPPRISDDVPVLRVSLPGEVELRKMIDSVVTSNEVEASDTVRERAAVNVRGMTLFAAENAVARKCLTGSLDADALYDVRRAGIESATGGALVFERETFTFQDTGGLDALRSYMERLFAGPDAPELVVRLDEIDKVVSAAATGAVADNTGVAQDMLRSLLTAIEDGGWLFTLLTGTPGSGKTMSTIATGNTFGRTTLAADFGRCKGSLLGQSEAAVRKVLDVVKALGGQRVLLAATANRMDTLPPELLSRAGAGGIWFFDVPGKAERDVIWALQRKRYGIAPEDVEPESELWVGRDIRNCCRTARSLGLPLKEAATYTMITGVVSQELVAQSRYLAATSGFLSASTPGRYRPPGSIRIEDLKTIAAGGRKIVPVSGGVVGEG